MKHRWIGLGGGLMSNEQAMQWGDATPDADGFTIATTDLEILLTSVVCAVCLSGYEEALERCPGPPDDSRNEHLWQGFFTAPFTDEEAAEWADPDGDVQIGFPQSISVTCVLCGAAADDPGDRCEERALWARDPGDHGRGDPGD
jgi:hypothetical protein